MWIKLYVEVLITDEQGHIARSVLEKTHTGLITLTLHWHLSPRAI